MLGERITSVPGSSAYFLGGFIAYSNEMKTELLGVSPETLDRFGAVSRETAEAMAKGARRRTGSSCAVSVTGLAGPDASSGPETAPVGAVFIGVADAAGVDVAQRVFLGDRQRIRTFTANFALDVLRRRLLGLSRPPSSLAARLPLEKPPAR
jgi:nicotinamide-nucleotide amidase